LIVLLLVAVIFISGCIGPSPEPKCPDCQSPRTWSACTDDAVKTRTNYRCGAETNYTCESYIEEKACRTEIKMKGARGILEAIVSPTLDETVKGVIKVEALTVPEKTDMIKFFLAPQGIQLGSQMTGEDLANINLESDANAADGWKIFYDTTKLENGLYTVFVGLTYEGAPDESPWLDYAKTQVVVKN